VVQGGGAVSYERGTPVSCGRSRNGVRRWGGQTDVSEEHRLLDGARACTLLDEREFFIDNLLVRLHFIIVIGLAPWEFEFTFPGCLTSTWKTVTRRLVRSSRRGFQFGKIPPERLWRTCQDMS